MKSAATAAAGFLSYVLLLTGQIADGQNTNLSAALTPPMGNSPKKVLKPVNAFQEYTCVDGTWVLGTAYATVVDATTTKVVGNYTSRLDKYGGIATFALLNSKGDSEESGDGASLVRARPIASSGNENVSESLLEAESHENFGSAATVSYIQVYNAKVGPPSAKENCSKEIFKVSRSVPFTAEFRLWSQDPLPPSMPARLVPPGRVIDGFYGKGDIAFRYNGSAWMESGREGKLYNLPGSPVIGEFSEKDGLQSWRIFDPNGFLVLAKLRAPGVPVSKTGCPWTSSVVTSTPSSSWSHLGSFTNVQTASTRGGLPPTRTYQVLAGAVTKVEFSAIYWFYTQLKFPSETTVTAS